MELDAEHAAKGANPEELFLASATEKYVISSVTKNCKAVLPNTSGRLQFFRTEVDGIGDVLDTLLPYLLGCGRVHLFLQGEAHAAVRHTDKSLLVHKHAKQFSFLCHLKQKAANLVLSVMHGLTRISYHAILYLPLRLNN